MQKKLVEALQSGLYHRNDAPATEQGIGYSLEGKPEFARELDLLLQQYLQRLAVALYAPNALGKDQGALFLHAAPPPDGFEWLEATKQDAGAEELRKQRPLWAMMWSDRFEVRLCMRHAACIAETIADVL